MYYFEFHKESTDEFRCHDHNQNYLIGQKSSTEMNDMTGLPQMQSHMQLKNILETQLLLVIEPSEKIS